MWRYPLGSGGNRVTTFETRPDATSAATIWRMKSRDRSGLGEGVSLVTVRRRLRRMLGRGVFATAHHTPGGVGWRAGFEPRTP